MRNFVEISGRLKRALQYEFKKGKERKGAFSNFKHKRYLQYNFVYSAEKIAFKLDRKTVLYIFSLY